MIASADVAVIGGGLHGCSAALHLVMAHRSVLVLEKDHVARHASGVNAGGVRRLDRHLAEVPLSVASMEMWHRIEEIVDDSCGFESHGHVKVAESEADLNTLRQRATQLRSIGFDYEEVIDCRELRDLLPAISTHCVGGLVSRRDGAALPFRTTLAFKRKAERLGARFYEGTRFTNLIRANRVWRITTDRGVFEAPVVVNAAGAWGGNIAMLLGEPVPIEANAYMLMITAPMTQFVKPVVGSTSRALSLKQFTNGTVLIGGGHKGRAWPDTNRTALVLENLASNARIASEIFPPMHAAAIVRTWAGIEGRMPDDIPVLGSSSTSEGVWHSFGYSAHGFQMGPVCGSIIAELVTTGSTDFPIEPFNIRRFTRHDTDTVGVDSIR